MEEYNKSGSAEGVRIDMWVGIRVVERKGRSIEGGEGYEGRRV